MMKTIVGWAINVSDDALKGLMALAELKAGGGTFLRAKLLATQGAGHQRPPSC